MVLGTTFATISEDSPVFDKLKDSGIYEIKPQEWYPQSVFVEALNGVDEEVALNITQPTFPASLTELEQVLEIMNEAYRQSHTHVSSDEGWDCKKLANGEYRIIDNSPYGFEYTYQLIATYIEHFAGKDQPVMVLPEDHNGASAFRVVML